MGHIEQSMERPRRDAVGAAPLDSNRQMHVKSPLGSQCSDQPGIDAERGGDAASTGGDGSQSAHRAGSDAERGGEAAATRVNGSQWAEQTGSDANLFAGEKSEAAHAAGAAPLLRAQNVHRVLGTGDSANHILKGVSLAIARREYVSIVGASGSGKSTLLYLLGGLDRPSRSFENAPFDPVSAVYIDGRDTSKLNDVELAALRNENVGFVFQFHYLLKEFTAQENVCLPMFKLGKLSREAAMERSAELLGQLGLGDKIRRRANRLSGGEQQRVAIARAMANEPAALLADEPTGNLDKHNSELVADIFQQLSHGGQTIIMVTHDLAVAKRARRRVTMEDGNVVLDEA
ncbi:MAG TPA: ABC transporter ATP-binding protein [Tepidisphaeraceae bacterium]|nr:ABC transporter ATP-binding protein [Tepidisphaeraceae bacterium]